MDFIDDVNARGKEKGWFPRHKNTCNALNLSQFNDVCYNFTTIPWANLERKAALERVGVSSLTNFQIIYCAKPIDNESIARAKKYFK